MSRTFDSPAESTLEEAEAALSRLDYAQLPSMIIGLALHGYAAVGVEVFLARASTCEDARVRGCAIIGFGHLARRHGLVDRVSAEALVRAALSDSDAFVRGQSEAALDDIEHFLGRDGRAGA